MMSSTTTRSSLVLLVATLLAGMAQAEEPAKLSLAATSWLRIDGDSTLHKYRAETRQLEAAFQVESASGAVADVEGLVRASAIKGLVLTIPVVGLRSGEGGLDDNLRKALGSEKHPNIVWRLDAYDVTGSGATLDLVLHGHLSVAGVERAVDVTAKGVGTPTGLRLTGQQRLSMRDYGVQPPVLFLGTIKTADTIVISFDLLVQAAK